MSESPHSFGRKVLTLVGGNAGAQAVLVASSPLLTRLYSPEDFGVFALFLATLSLVAVVSSLRYEAALPIPQETGEASNLVALALVATLVTTAVTAVGLAMGGEALALALGAPALAANFWMLPLALLGMGAYQILHFTHLRAEAFGVLARARIFRSLIGLPIQLAAFGLGPTGLITGQSFAQCVGVLPLIRSLVRRRLIAPASISLAGMAAVARRYRSFPLWSSWAVLLSTGSAQIPLLAFATMFSPVEAGLFALAQRVLNLPVITIANAVADVLNSIVNDARRTGRLAGTVTGLVGRLVQLALVPMLVLALAAPDLFAFVFGEPWRAAGTIVQALSPWIFLTFVVSPLMRMFAALQRNRRHMLLELSFFTLRLGGILLGYLLSGGDFAVTVLCYGLANATSMLVYLQQSLSIAGTPIRPVLAAAARYGVPGLVVLIPLALCLWAGSFVVPVAFATVALHGLINVLPVMRALHRL